jgi:hypothetical protein
MAHSIKEKLLTTLENIPENKLCELLDFMEFLIAKQRHKTEGKFTFDPEKDPVPEFIGCVSHGSLLKDIDNELYGEIN